jgi:hypothetical protein
MKISAEKCDAVEGTKLTSVSYGSCIRLLTKPEAWADSAWRMEKGKLFMLTTGSHAADREKLSVVTVDKGRLMYVYKEDLVTVVPNVEVCIP